MMKRKEKKILEEIIEEVEAGEMPLSNYIITHPEAKLEQSKIVQLKEWVTSGGGEVQSLRYKKNVEKY